MEGEKERLLDELREMKKVAEEANLRLSEALLSQTRPHKFSEIEKSLIDELERSSIDTAKKRDQAWHLELEAVKNQHAMDVDALSSALQELNRVHQELESLKESLADSREQLEIKHINLEVLRIEFEKAKQELKLQTEQLEQTNILLEESRVEVTCLNDKVAYLERSAELATDAEEKSRKAMDDMALALREVSIEANEAKGKLISSQSEREKIAMSEVECLKQVMKSTEEKYVGLLSEARNEINHIKDEAERLRLEVEESNLAWNRKELGFINCIKKAEEEFHDTIQENIRLLESMREAEDMSKASKEETNRLRDILKQALNEANVAKEAAEIARTENYQLKDSVAEKDSTLQDLTGEIERLKINEATSLENIKDLKRLLSTETAKVLSVDIEGLRVSNGYKEADEDPKMDKTIKTSSVYTDDAEMLNSEDFDHLDGNQANNMDRDRNKHRKKRALLKRFGDLLKNNLP